MPEKKNSPDLHHTPLTSTEARQGRYGKPVFYVLACSLILAVIAWTAAEIWGEATDQDASGSVVDTPSQIETNTPSGAGTFDDNPAGGQSRSPEAVDKDPTYQSGTGGDSQQVTPDGTER
jgi:hypothetical protein